MHSNLHLLQYTKIGYHNDTYSFTESGHNRKSILNQGSTGRLLPNPVQINGTVCTVCIILPIHDALVL